MIMEDAMAKGQMRSNREPKKPKKKKAQAAAPTSVFSNPPPAIKAAQYAKRQK
jgi:hypothetical protein